MKSMIRILTVLVCLAPHATAVAQEPQLAAPLRDTASREVTIVIRQQQLRFTAPVSTQEIRLEVFNKGGESVYDSGPVTGQELSWNLQNESGEAVPSGLYAYTLTVKEANAETPTLRRGHLILESGRDRIWVTNQGAIGAEESLSGGELTISSAPERSVAGALMGRAPASRSTLNLDFFGTPGRIPKFTGSDSLDDSVIWQDFNGRIGIGTDRPGTALLTVAGQIETTSGGIKFPNGTVQTTSAAGALFQVFRNSTLTGNGTEGAPLGVNVSGLNLLSAVERDTTLAGNGTTASPLGIANGGVTGPKIASGQVVKSLNGLFDSVSLSAGANITITPSGNGLSIAAPNLLGSVERNGTLTGNGTGASPLGVAVPLSLSGSSSGPILEITNAFGTGIIASGGANGRFNEGAGVRAFGGNGDLGGTGVFASGGDSHSDSSRSEGGEGGVFMGGSAGNGSGGRGLIAFGGRRVGDGAQAPAGAFDGDVRIIGTLSKSAGSFRIDHPLDPANKYLSHSFVESPDMKNIYDGIVRLDADGYAIVELPEWFEALNKDFRYLLTPVGAPMPGLYIAEKVSGNRFKIAGGQPGLEVSWQVTGIRQDAYANKYRIQVEEDKSERERGFYLQPEVFSQPEEKSIEWARNPNLMREIKNRRDNAESRRPDKGNDR